MYNISPIHPPSNLELHCTFLQIDEFSVDDFLNVQFPFSFCGALMSFL